MNCGNAIASNVQAQLRADNFCCGRKIEEIKRLNQLLSRHVDNDVIRKVESQILQTYGRKHDEFHRSLLRYLSRVSADVVWDQSVEAVVEEFHGIKIQRAAQPEGARAR